MTIYKYLRIFRYRRLASVSALFFFINSILNMWLTLLDGSGRPVFDLENDNIKLSWLKKQSKLRQSDGDRRYPFGYVMLPSKEYIENSDTSLIIIYLRCHFKEFEERRLVRESWGRDMRRRYNVAIVFVTGVPEITNQTVNEMLNRESDANGDLIVAGFTESYSNLTLKMWAILNWQDTYYSGSKRDHPKLMFWGNVDAVVLPHNLIGWAEKLAYTRNIISGYILRGVRPVRKMSDKWYVPKTVYRFETYPDFIWGSGVFATWDAADLLLIAIEQAPAKVIASFTPDDVLMTGIWRNRMNIQLYQCRYCRAYTDFTMRDCDDWKTTIFAHGPQHFLAYKRLRQECTSDWQSNLDEFKEVETEHLQDDSVNVKDRGNVGADSKTKDSKEGEKLKPQERMELDEKMNDHIRKLYENDMLKRKGSKERYNRIYKKAVKKVKEDEKEENEEEVNPQVVKDKTVTMMLEDNDNNYRGEKEDYMNELDVFQDYKLESAQEEEETLQKDL